MTAGNYDIVCNLAQHYGKGMRAALHGRLIPCTTTRSPLPRSAGSAPILTAVVIVVVGIAILVYGSNAVLTKVHGKTRSSLVGDRDAAVLRRPDRARVGAAAAPAPEDDLMSVPVVPDAEWLWENEPCRAACPVTPTRAPTSPRSPKADSRTRTSSPARRTRSRRSAAASAPRRASRRADGAPSTRRSSIRALKRFVTERFGVESFAANTFWHEAHGPVPPASGPSVGVIGGGPAGLAAAYDLRLAGHPVTVYEAQDRLGGMMVLGIPEYRLPRALIAREIEAIVELGIDVETGSGSARRTRSPSCSTVTQRSSSRSAPGAAATSTCRATSSTACCAPSSTCST